MASTHKHIRSSTANKRPTTAIADGQIALNTNSTSPGLFFKDSTGATIIKVGPVHVGTTAPNVSPAAGGSSGNSTGEVWLDTSLTPNGVKIWNGASWTNATPIGSTTVQGLLELATNAETQTGTDPDRAVTPAGLQSKVSDSTSTTSSTTIASSTAVKAAYDLANAAIPASGGTVTGNLEIGTTGSLTFEGSTANGFETTLAVVDPTADQTITLPNVTGTVITTGDTGTVTSTMIANGTIVNDDISATAEIAVSKLADGTARQLLQTDAAGTGVEWTSNVDIPGTLDVTGAAVFDSTVNIAGSLSANTVVLSSSAADATTKEAKIQCRHYTSSEENVMLLYGASTSTENFVLLGGGSSSQNSANYIGFLTAANNTTTSGSERARIDSSGRLLVGTSTARSNVYSGGSATTPQNQFEFNSNSSNSGVSLINYSNTGFSPTLTMGLSQSGTQGANAALNSGIDLGLINFVGNDGTNFRTGAYIIATADAAFSTGSAPTRLGFWTTASGASTPTERFRIRPDGNMGFFNTPGIYPNTDNAAGIGFSGFRWSSVYAANGTIQTSDRRAKTEVSDASLGSDFIKALRPVSYKWIEGGKRDTGERDADGNYVYEAVPGQRTHWGFVAQEVKEVVDAAGVDFGGWVLTDKDDPDSQQALRYDQFIAPLTKALQETMAELEALKAEVAALKAQ